MKATKWLTHAAGVTALRPTKGAQIGTLDLRNICLKFLGKYSMNQLRSKLIFNYGGGNSGSLLAGMFTYDHIR